MVPTTHIAASCLLTVYTIQSSADDFTKLLTVTAGSLLAHLVLDLVPHGFIATPYTIFKKFIPTAMEIIPGPLILLSSIWLFGNPLLFLVACVCGLIPDLCTTLLWRGKERARKIPCVSLIHVVHRKAHWFETEHADGTISYLFPNRPLLVSEAICTVCLLALLFSRRSAG